MEGSGDVSFKATNLTMGTTALGINNSQGGSREPVVHVSASTPEYWSTNQCEIGGDVPVSSPLYVKSSSSSSAGYGRIPRWKVEVDEASNVVCTSL